MGVTVTLGVVLVPLATPVVLTGLDWSTLVNAPLHPTMSEVPLQLTTTFAVPADGATNPQISTPFFTRE